MTHSALLQIPLCSRSDSRTKRRTTNSLVGDKKWVEDMLDPQLVHFSHESLDRIFSLRRRRISSEQCGLTRAVGRLFRHCRSRRRERSIARRSRVCIHQEQKFDASARQKTKYVVILKAIYAFEIALDLSVCGVVRAHG